jgi:hypothetical protein
MNWEKQSKMTNNEDFKFFYNVWVKKSTNLIHCNFVDVDCELDASHDGKRQSIPNLGREIACCNLGKGNCSNCHKERMGDSI